MELKFSFTEADFSAAGDASKKVKTLMKQLGFPPGMVRRCAVCMYEGEMNVIIHGGGGTGRVTIGDSSVTIEFSDSGPGIPDIDLAMTEGYSTAPEKVRAMGFGAGMGLPNMKKNSDTFDIESTPGKGTKITVRIDKENK